MLQVIVAAITAAVMWIVRLVFRNLSDTKHSAERQGIATPGRTAPNPKYFPYYMQNAQGLWLRWTAWRPQSKPCGVVLLVGGLAEHTARYDYLGTQFAAKGFVAFSMDHQGQGLSEGDRKHIERFDNFVDDQVQFLRARFAAEPELESLPRFILGHSMGGLITATLATRHPRAFNGVVLSAPALYANPKKATPFLKAVVSVLANVFPKLPVEKLDADTVSDNAQIVQHYKTDPIIPTVGIRARWAHQMLTSIERLWTRIDRATFPVLLLHGSRDEIVLLQGSEDFAQKSPSVDKKLIVYEGALHELFTDERVGDRVMADVFTFVEARMKKVHREW